MRVLVAMDESPATQRAVSEAARLFGPLDPEFLVIRVSRYGVFDELEPLPPLDSPPTWQQWEHEERARREAAVALAQDAGLTDATVIVETGDPAGAICAAAEGHHVDVVVIGDENRNLIQRLFTPPVSSAVVRGTSIPVLVVTGDEN